MRYQLLRKPRVLLSLVVIVMLVAQVSAQSAATPARPDRPVRPERGQARGRGRGSMGINGDWKITMENNNRQTTAILSFSINRETRALAGNWISFRGITELKDVAFEDNKLTFKQTTQFRGQESTSEFAGTLKDGKITGTLKRDRGDSKVVGERVIRLPRCVGSWAMKITAGEREYSGTLTITADKERKLSGKWISRRGESDVRDITYERGRLTFKRVIGTGDNKRESTFEGTLRQGITGVFKSERGEAQATGELIGAAVIGQWNLDIASERGSRKQRLKVNSDLSGMYGSMPIEKINLKENQVSFKIVMKFGEREFEMNFKGEIKEDKLTGEMTTSRGTRKVTGKKIVRISSRTRRTRPTGTRPTGTRPTGTRPADN